MVSIKEIKELRSVTGVSITECKKALEQAKGNLEKARTILKEKGKEFARKRLGRETKEGIIDAYIHPGSKVGVLIELQSESDFVARSEDFKNLSHELCLQIAALPPEDVDSLFEQQWIRDSSKSVKDLINDYISKFGENISLKRFIRYEL